ncbi:MAG TPA: hypothetical protein VM910_16140 [Bradyrhizobium sp.]|nr:hypothetical protein [Bradyrhizobium sp.]
MPLLFALRASESLGWLINDEDFLGRCAREAQADKLFKECLETADRRSESENENPQRIRRDQLRINTRKWMAARLAPKKYGRPYKPRCPWLNYAQLPAGHSHQGRRRNDHQN